MYEITKSATKLYDKYAILKNILKLISSYRTHGLNLQKVISNSWGEKDSLEKQMINLKISMAWLQLKILKLLQQKKTKCEI